MKLFENKNQYRQSYQQEKHSRCAEYLLKVGIPSPRRSVEPAVFPRLQHAFPPELFASQQIFGIRKPFSRIRVAVSFYFVPLDEHHVVLVLSCKSVQVQKMIFDKNMHFLTYGNLI